MMTSPLAMSVADRFNIAADLHRRGVRSFLALHSNGKRPIGDDWPNRSASDLTVVEQWAGNGNLGVMPGRSGLLVVDIDTKNGAGGMQSVAELEFFYDELPRTYTVETPSGGTHRYYSVPRLVATRKGWRRGIDVICGTGQVVAPGSTLPNGAYRVIDDAPIAPAPQWLLDLLEEAKPDVAVVQQPMPGTWTDADRERVIHWLTVEAPPAIEGQHGDDTTLTVLRRAKDFGVPDVATMREMFAGYYNSRCQPPWEERDIDRLSRSAFRNAEKPPGAASPSAEFAPVLAESPPVLFRQLPIDFDPRTLPRRPWVLGNRLLRGALSEGMAAPGGMKSTMHLCSAIAICTGRGDITGEQVHMPGNVILYDAEEPWDEILRRVAGVCRQFGVAFADIRPRLTIASGVDLPLVVARRFGKNGTLDLEQTTIDYLIRKAREVDAIGLCAGPLIALSRGAQENNEDLEVVMRAFAHIAGEGNCAADVSHHTTKVSATAKDSGAGDMYIGRGGSSQVGVARVVYTITGMDKETRERLSLTEEQALSFIRMDLGKGNYSPRGKATRWYRVESAEVGNGASRAGAEFIHPNEDATLSETVGVPVPYDMAAAERVARGEAAKDSEAMVRAVVLAMPSDRCSRKAVVEAVMTRMGCKETTAESLVNALIPDGEPGVTVTIDGRVCAVRRERKGTHATAPVELIRAWGDAEGSAS